MDDWKDVPSLLGVVMVTMDGKVRTYPHTAACRNVAKPTQRRKGKLLSPYVEQHGYKSVSITRNGKRSRYLVHRLVAEAFLRPPREGETVDHLDGNRLNNHISNLEWVTRSENTRRQNADGRGAPKGEDHPLAKLKNSDVPQIFTLREGGASLRQIAERFSVSIRLIHRILKGERRAHANAANSALTSTRRALPQSGE